MVTETNRDSQRVVSDFSLFVWRYILTDVVNKLNRLPEYWVFDKTICNN